MVHIFIFILYLSHMIVPRLTDDISVALRDGPNDSFVAFLLTGALFSGAPTLDPRVHILPIFQISHVRRTMSSVHFHCRAPAAFLLVRLDHFLRSSTAATHASRKIMAMRTRLKDYISAGVQLG